MEFSNRVSGQCDSRGYMIERLTVCSQTSVRSGKLLEMGKGFCASDGLLGEDLADIITRCCKKRVRLAKHTHQDTDGCRNFRSTSPHSLMMALPLSFHERTRPLAPLDLASFSVRAPTSL
jgi:hypothetical protein